ncbi:pentapeptide repeat-containing protein [Actibacterium sp. 188UL27-1]|uniref:pentapeptide repeat-containing protein n=1 Tax=Actibacterium sp. 188UL27-1 TaxID=2786961 RepID=UPI00195A83F2|nr:pentapeptide repeat-containing protein [Actibacterium sp. 188UL27-1]MBM7068539.1 pentapeptide repeat-containing protein [Actibacterium sp. 188UL27-1]
MSEQEHANPFDGPQMQSVHYKRADMAGANFDGVNLEDARFYAVLTKAKFTDTNLQDVDFDDVNLANGRFNNVDLSGAAITNANLSKLTVRGATLAHADIQDADLTGMRINGVLVTDLFHAYEKSQN